MCDVQCGSCARLLLMVWLTCRHFSNRPPLFGHRTERTGGWGGGVLINTTIPRASNEHGRLTSIHLPFTTFFKFYACNSHNNTIYIFILTLIGMHYLHNHYQNTSIIMIKGNYKWYAKRNSFLLDAI